MDIRKNKNKEPNKFNVRTGTASYENKLNPKPPNTGLGYIVTIVLKVAPIVRTKDLKGVFRKRKIIVCFVCMEIAK